MQSIGLLRLRQLATYIIGSPISEVKSRDLFIQRLWSDLNEVLDVGKTSWRVLDVCWEIWPESWPAFAEANSPEEMLASVQGFFDLSAMEAGHLFVPGAQVVGWLRGGLVPDCAVEWAENICRFAELKQNVGLYASTGLPNDLRSLEVDVVTHFGKVL